jgi:hypothetical protein
MLCSSHVLLCRVRPDDGGEIHDPSHNCDMDVGGSDRSDGCVSGYDVRSLYVTDITSNIIGPHLTEAHMGSTNVEVFCTCTVIARKYLLSRNYVAVNHIGQEITVLARGCKRGEIPRGEFLTYLTWQKEQSFPTAFQIVQISSFAIIRWLRRVAT